MLFEMQSSAKPEKYEGWQGWLFSLPLWLVMLYIDICIIMHACIYIYVCMCVCVCKISEHLGSLHKIWLLGENWMTGHDRN